MSELNINKKTIRLLLQEANNSFLIPDYQRPYAWTEDECLTLWEDICNFSIPGNNYEAFDKTSFYFLGPVVTFINNNNQSEIIDGQQRITTIMLLLRAFYNKLKIGEDKESKLAKEDIERCLWFVGELGDIDYHNVKIDSQVATEDDKEEFIEILKNGEASANSKSKYAKNFKFFQEKIDEFNNINPSAFIYLPNRVLKNCILLPIEAESQDTALDIFNTLNNRGKPLADADIFKSHLYRYYVSLGLKDEFIAKWRDLEELCNKIFGKNYENPLDEIFTRYMYYERAKLGIKSSTTEALRKFYEGSNSGTLLKNKDVFENIILLANFWNDILSQDEELFSERVLRKISTLSFAPNNMWTYIVSVYFMKHKSETNQLDEDKFYNFLSSLVLFVLTNSVVNHASNSLRTPIFTEMISIIDGDANNFKNSAIKKELVINSIENFQFSNNKPITKSMLAWWAYENEGQVLIKLSDDFQIEHIFARKRRDLNMDAISEDELELLGNKSLLEKTVNVRASDYRFDDKKKKYCGYQTANGIHKKGTNINELVKLSMNTNDFGCDEILKRNDEIITRFISELEKNGLVN